MRNAALNAVMRGIALFLILAGGAPSAAHAAGAAAALARAKAPAATLERVRTVRLGAVTVTRYEERIGGIPVLGAEAAVLDSPGAPARLAMDATKAVPAAPPRPRISASDAISIAIAATGTRGLRGRPRAPLAIDPSHGDALVRRALIPAWRPMADFEVIVNAVSGRVLATRDLLQHLVGHARLYTPNPVAVNGGYAGIGQGPFADHRDRNTRKLTRLRRRVELQGIKAGQHCLVGRFVQARLGKKRGRPVCKRGLRWGNVRRKNNRFEALMAYYHVDTIQRYFRSLGFKGSSSTRPGRQTVVADAFAEDNSFYSPVTRRIMYGSGGVDDAEDGDVITHEYGHAIQAAQSPGFSDCRGCLEAESLGEGFGDFVSIVNTAISPNVPPSYLERAESCIFDWDGTAGYNPQTAPCGRVADGSDGVTTLPVARSVCQGDPHCIGEVWSSGLMDLLRSLAPDGQGRPPIVVDLLTSQFAYSRSERFSEAVDGLVAADEAIYGGTHVAAICGEMELQRQIPASDCS